MIALRERGGPIQAFVVPNTSKAVLQGHVRAIVEQGSNVYTDEATSYKSLDKAGYQHEAVRHSAGEYVKEKASTNSVESFWSLLKRGYIGTHHWWSFKHLHRYVAEYVYRQNTRRVHGLNAIGELIRSSEDARLTYDSLIS